MGSSQFAEAKTHFSQLRGDAERGQTTVIARHRRPIARLVAEPASRGADGLAVCCVAEAEGVGLFIPMIDAATVFVALNRTDQGSRGSAWTACWNCLWTKSCSAMPCA